MRSVALKALAVGKVRSVAVLVGLAVLTFVAPWLSETAWAQYTIIRSEISVTPDRLDFSGNDSRTVTINIEARVLCYMSVPQQVQLYWYSSVQYSGLTPVNWLTVDPPSGNITAQPPCPAVQFGSQEIRVSGTTSVTVRVNATNLGPGTYNATIIFGASGGGTAMVAVTLQLTPRMPVRAELTIDRGCGATYAVGDNITVTVRSGPADPWGSGSISFRVLEQQSNGQTTEILTGVIPTQSNRNAPDGRWTFQRTYQITGPTGPRTYILQVLLGNQWQEVARCSFQVVGGPGPGPQPPLAPATAQVTINGACGQSITLGANTVIGVQILGVNPVVFPARVANFRLRLEGPQGQFVFGQQELANLGAGAVVNFPGTASPPPGPRTITLEVQLPNGQWQMVALCSYFVVSGPGPQPPPNQLITLIINSRTTSGQPLMAPVELIIRRPEAACPRPMGLCPGDQTLTIQAAGYTLQLPPNTAIQLRALPHQGRNVVAWVRQIWAGRDRGWQQVSSDTGINPVTYSVVPCWGASPCAGDPNQLSIVAEYSN